MTKGRKKSKGPPRPPRRLGPPAPTAVPAITIGDGAHNVTILDVESKGMPLVGFERDGDVHIVDSLDRNARIRDRHIESRSDEHAAAMVTFDIDSGASVTAVELKHPTKDEEETKSGRAFASAWTAERGEEFDWEPQYDTSKFEDGYLVPRGADAAEDRVPVQITQLDANLKAALSREGEVVDWSLDMLASAVLVAVARKQAIDADAKAATILVLTCPVALGALVSNELRQFPVATGGYRAIWVCPGVGAPFEIPRLDTDDGAAEL